MFIRCYSRGVVISALILALAIGCGDSSTGPEDNGISYEGIFTSLLSVAVIPGAVETFTITATDQNGLPDSCTVSCSNEAVATFTHIDSLVEVTGKSYGNATLTITGASGSVKEIPIQVYNHRVLDVGELQIQCVTQFEERWRASTTPPCYYYASFYHPITDDGFHALGSIGIPLVIDPNGKYAAIVVKEANGSDALRSPVSYELKWSSYGQGDNLGYPSECRIYEPICPDGYKALGMVADVGTWWSGARTGAACVREDLTIPGSAGETVWLDKTSGIPQDRWPYKIGCFNIYPDTIDDNHEIAWIGTGTFVGWRWWEKPEKHDVMNVLKIDLPMLAEAPPQTYWPRLESIEEPPEYTVPTMSYAMLVPATIINDPYFDVGERVENSPFYVLERQVFYKKEFYRINTGTIIQRNLWQETIGVTTTESTTFSETTSIEVKADVGLNIKCFSAGVSINFSRKFGYSNTHTISELKSHTIDVELLIPPRHAGALWRKCNRIVLKRHNGKKLEAVDRLEYATESYIDGFYPID